MSEIFHSVSQLGITFGKDPRTVQKLLKKIKPAHITATGRKQYRLKDVEKLLTDTPASAQLAAGYERLFALRADLRAVKRSIRMKGRLRAVDAQNEFIGRVVNLRKALLGMHARYGPQWTNAMAGADSASRLRSIFTHAADEMLKEMNRPFSWEPGPIPVCDSTAEDERGHYRAPGTIAPGVPLAPAGGPL